LLEQSVESIRVRYGLDSDVFDLTVPPGVEIFTDPTALEIVIKNVLDNAVKYSAAAPRVKIYMQELDTGQLAIVVRDQGIGIGRNQLKRIFRRFHRAPDPQVNERTGSGLGLYVADRLARNLGGRIRAESDGPGKGTTMRIRLPMSAMKTEDYKS
jgi:signal transduction histidine kinase